MAGIQIKRENQLERIEVMEGKIRGLQKTDATTLSVKPGPTSWNVLEVIEHMSTAHQPYEVKIETALKKLETKNTEKWECIEKKRMASFICRRMLPQNEVIKHKMKTSKKFQPVLPEERLSEDEINKVFDRFYNSLAHLKSTISRYANLPVKNVRFNSAIGPIVRFNTAEAVEFIISHNERHIVQAENTVKKNS